MPALQVNVIINVNGLSWSTTFSMPIKQISTLVDNENHTLELSVWDDASLLILVLFVKRNTLTLCSYFYWTFMLLLTIVTFGSY